MTTGGCHCGAIRYEVTGEPEHSALCHCSDCRKSAGAHMIGFALFSRDQISISGEPVRYQSSAEGERQFCGVCGASLFYVNETVFPGKIDIHTASLDDQAAYPPQAKIQLAEAAPWMASAHELPGFDRYPG